ncbi:MAG: sensor histidine kinase [Rhodanobacteraceae bacterium]
MAATVRSWDHPDELTRAAHGVDAAEVTGMRMSWKHAGVILVCWTLYGLLMTAPDYYDSSAVGSPIAWDTALAFSVYSAWLWAALTPLILWLARRLPLDSRKRVRNVATHAAIALAVVVAHSLFVRYTSLLVQQQLQLLPPTPSQAPWSVTKFVIAVAPYEVVVYCVVAAMGYAIDYFNRYRERERSLECASLQALKAQLNPHFLYNTLHAVSELGYQSPEAAEEVMTQLSDLLRLAFDGEDTQEVALEDELAFARKYLDIQKMLLGGRVTVRFDIEPSTLDAKVPNFVLQPLIENAIVHGIAPHSEPGWLEVSSRRRDASLVLAISNSRRGVAGDGIVGSGVGLANTRLRLVQLYGTAGRLDLDCHPQEKRFVVTVCIPFTHNGPKSNERHKNLDRGRRSAGTPSRPAVSR